MKTKEFKDNAKRFFDAYDKLWFEGENEDPAKIDEFCMQLVNYMRHVYEKGKAYGITAERTRMAINMNPSLSGEFVDQLAEQFVELSESAEYERGKADGIAEEKERLLDRARSMAEGEELILQCAVCFTPEFWCSIEDNGVCKECNINEFGETQEEAEEWVNQWAVK